MAAQQPGPPAVTNADILAGLPADGSKWLVYHGNYFGHRHSPLKQITPDNVAQLKAQWTFQTGRDRQLPVDADPGGQRAVRDGVQWECLGDRRALGPPNLEVPAECARRFSRVLRPGQSWVRRARESSLPVDAGRAPRGAGHEQRQRRVGHRARELQEGILSDRRAARGEGQGDHRHRRRRVPASGDSSKRSTSIQARSCGGSIRWRARANLAGRRGRRARMRTSGAAAPSG